MKPTHRQQKTRLVSQTGFMTKAAATEEAMHNEANAGETGNFAVWGCYLNNQPGWLGVTETYEEAVKLQGNMITAGWTRVAIFDAARQEVKEKPPTAGA